MTQIPEADIDYTEVKKPKDGEMFYSKTSIFGKPKYVIKHGKETYVFETYDAALLAELIIKLIKEAIRK